MTSETKLDGGKVNAILQSIVGEYVWGVRCGPDRILQLEFGDPYLRLQPVGGSLEAANGSGLNILQRRIIVPTGRWSLFIEDGSWTVRANGAECGRSDADNQMNSNILQVLSGQKLVSINASEGHNNLSLHFDLDGELVVSTRLDYSGNEQWMLFSKGEGVLSFSAEHGFTMEI